MKKNKFLKKVVITGSMGCIGTILKNGISKDFDLYFLDIKEKNGKKTFKIDISKEYKRLVSIFKNKDVVIHLAWDFFEDFPKDTLEQNNKLMLENVYRAAAEVGVKKVIMASSVHANDYSRLKAPQKISAIEDCWPDSPYGASKVYMEALGKYFSQYRQLEVICIRFGGVNAKNLVIYEEDPNYDKVLLYKEDCVNLIKKCVLAKKNTKLFSVFYAISENPNRVHDVSNHINWHPRYPLANKLK